MQNAQDMPLTASAMDREHTLRTAAPDHSLPPSLWHGAVVTHKKSKFIGTSARMQVLYEQIAHAARSQAPVFITGETGTGKEVCAQAIHQYSPRREGIFIPINCAAIRDEHLESELFGHVKGAFAGAGADLDGALKIADGGTLFLDDVSEMSPEIQAQFLNFLHSHSFCKMGGSHHETANIRIISACTKDPLEEVACHNLREDLFFRLHVIPIQMPALRERGDDVLDIAYILLKRFSQEEGKSFHDFSADVRAFFRHYAWPGNIRQLQNVIRYICVMHDSDLVTGPMLPRSLLHPPQDRVQEVTVAQPQLMAPPPPLHSSRPSPTDGTALADPFIDMKLAEIERYVIENTVNRMAGNIPQAAAHLGVAPSTLYRKRLSWAPEGRNPETEASLFGPRGR